MHSSIVGGSSAARILACPPSRILCQGVPESPDSVHSRRGTALHEAIEIAISTNAQPDELGGLVGAVIEGHTITADDVTGALLPALLAYRQFPWRPDTKPMLERQVSLPNIEDAFGTADVLGVGADGIPVVWDWKFGHGLQVLPEGNAQLMFYAAGAAFHEDTRRLFNHSHVRLVIVQPNNRDLPVLRDTFVPLADVFDFTVHLERAIDDGRAVPYNPGDHCRWCPAKLLCPKLNETARELPTVNRAKLTELLDLIGPLQDWTNEVLRVAHELLEAGEQVPRYKLVQKQPRRSWTDEKAASKRLTALGLKMDDLFDSPSLRSPAQIEKLISKEDKTHIQDLIDARSSGTVVVPETDKRPAVDGHEAALKRLATQLGN